MLGRTETRTRDRMYFRRYEQLETSPETIQQELRPAVCERRQTDIQTDRLKENYSIDETDIPKIEPKLRILDRRSLKTQPASPLTKTHKEDRYTCLSRVAMGVCKAIKGMFYIVQYPVHWTAQSALHFAPPLPPTRQTYSFRHQLCFSGEHSIHAAITRNDYSLTFPQLSIARYSFTQLSGLRHSGENENAQTSKR